MSMFVFLAGFAKGPSLHYCYSSGTISAEMHGMFSELNTSEDICKDEVEDSCCNLTQLLKSFGNCCEDISLDVSVSEFSQNLQHYSPQIIFVALLNLVPAFVFNAFSFVWDLNIPLFDWSQFSIPDVPIFIKYSIFRI